MLHICVCSLLSNKKQQKQDCHSLNEKQKWTKRKTQHLIHTYENSKLGDVEGINVGLNVGESLLLRKKNKKTTQTKNTKKGKKAYIKYQR